MLLRGSAPGRPDIKAQALSPQDRHSNAPARVHLPTPPTHTPPQLILPPRQQPKQLLDAQGNALSRGSTLIPAAAATALPSTSISSKKGVVFLPEKKQHSLHDQGVDVITSLTGWAEENLKRYLKMPGKCWQPTDYLPESSSPDFFDAVQQLRQASGNLPSDYLVVLVGDMVTEEALPTYMSMLNRLDYTRDETGAQDHPWAVWTRWWTSEENRHGELLNKYLYLSGRVDMRAIETTIQRLISKGMDPQLENNPYLCFVYTSFQERATKISHGNTARLATYYGDHLLAKICGLIASDEGRHEQAYQAIVRELFQRDPNGAMLAFADMMRKGIVMPAHYVDDGVHSDSNKGAQLFADYATVADKIGVYTTSDYADIVDYLVARWKVADVTGLSGEAAEAQEFLCSHASRIRRLANIQAERRLRDKKRGKTREASFSWVFGRQVGIE